jgi:hypothetical protein
MRKRISGALLSLGVLLVSASPAIADAVYQQPDDFIREVFAGLPPKPRLLWLNADAQKKLSAIFGHPYPQARLRYWRTQALTAWVLEDIGKEYPITAGFVVAQGKLGQARVLVYRESRGDEIHYPAFLRQFQGAALKDEGLSKPIDGISGATLSVWAMQRMARAALTLDALAPPP